MSLLKQVKSDAESGAQVESPSNKFVQQRVHSTSFAYFWLGKTQSMFQSDFSIKENELSHKAFGTTSFKLQDVWKHLAQQIKLHKWKNIHFLTFKLSSKMEDPRDLENVGKYITKLFPEVKKISITFQPMKLDSDAGLDRFICQLTRNLKHLQELTLEIFGGEKSKGILQLIGKEIGQNFPSLRKFRLRFSWASNATDQGVQTIAHQLRSLTQLKDLELNFNRTSVITDEGLKAIGVAFDQSNLHQLQHLNLNFTMNRVITCEGVEKLALAIGRNFPNLQTLKVSLEYCDLISDKSLEVLTNEIVNNLKSLNSLQLKFAMSKITDKGVAYLVSELKKNLSNLTLKKIQVETNYCEKVSGPVKAELNDLMSKINPPVQPKFGGSGFGNSFGGFRGVNSGH